MENFSQALLKKLYVSSPHSHKGQNGKLLIIGGSHLFHSASLWALKVASRIVDMVFYSSVSENNKIVQKLKEEFRDGIVVPRDKLAHYAHEADCILIGPGLPRPEGMEKGDEDTKKLTETLLKKYPQKRWVIDGGSLQVMDPELLKKLHGNVIVTPHHKEFTTLFGGTGNTVHVTRTRNTTHVTSHVSRAAKEYNTIVLLKGPIDIVCSPSQCVQIAGGNAGMTKGGTGDVLAGLVAALACKNDLFLSACAGSYINKKAGDALFARVEYNFNASDLAEEIPRVMKRL